MNAAVFTAVSLTHTELYILSYCKPLRDKGTNNERKVSVILGECCLTG